ARALVFRRFHRERKEIPMRPRLRASSSTSAKLAFLLGPRPTWFLWVVLMAAPALSAPVPPQPPFLLPAFTEYDGGMSGSYIADACWGDFDGDGRLDAALVGSLDDTPLSAIYYNFNPANFVDIQADATNAQYAGVAWGDYDNDGDIDLLLAGQDVYNNLTL